MISMYNYSAKFICGNYLSDECRDRAGSMQITLISVKANTWNSGQYSRAILTRHISHFVK